MLQNQPPVRACYNNLLVKTVCCPVCHSADLGEWGSSAGYSLFRCRVCSHRFADVRGYTVEHEDPDVFRNAFTHGLMSSDLDYYNHLRSGEAPGCPTVVTAEHLLTIFQRLAVHSGRWLDVGCGSGYLLEQVQRRGWDAIGVEPGGWGQIAAKERGLHVMQGYLSADTFAAPFDIVSATDVLEHQPDPNAFLKILSHHVSDDGYVIVSFPCADSFICRMIGSKWSMVAPPTHCQFFSRKSFRLLATNAGFSLITLRQYSVLHLMGATKYRFMRLLVDAILTLMGGGDQALAILQRKPQKDEKP